VKSLADWEEKRLVSPKRGSHFKGTGPPVRWRAAGGEGSSGVADQESEVQRKPQMPPGKKNACAKHNSKWGGKGIFAEQLLYEEGMHKKKKKKKRECS